MVIRAASEVTKVNDVPVLPEHGMQRFLRRSNTLAGGTSSKTAVVYKNGSPVGIAIQRRKFLGNPVLPQNGLAFEHLERANCRPFNAFCHLAGIVYARVFSYSCDFRVIVDLACMTIVSAKCWKLY